jgi:hypothetical protein
LDKLGSAASLGGGARVGSSTFGACAVTGDG